MLVWGWVPTGAKHLLRINLLFLLLPCTSKLFNVLLIPLVLQVYL
jgi:hypothetical protein